MNEILLIISLFFIYGMVLITYRYFGKSGLYVMIGVVTILANIEVVLLVDAFGMEQTLGNILFASTFLITDILSECEGKKSANKSVFISIIMMIFFLVISQSWIYYTPSVNDMKMDSIRNIFTSVPRVIFSSLSVYAISQFVDVWLYHKWWDFTSKKIGNKDKFLWVRNNGSTLISQIFNTVLFTLFAFGGVYDVNVIVSMILSSYIIFVITSVMDTPFVYIARKIKKGKSNQI
ncbi:queuosine precursor transporter [Candidatus Arthromitus sp. SFB-rat-Yit]|uniref:queuosine precursor transporter n=1 Tax=Candidatus Arthromitus sp. SFB-rat-Yit TaxID=1041504 RepID=UPI0002F5ED6B|nr:queuosine precursor transporter [Candidatus Arthromitus sp. SFB-rat-Yit]